MNAQAPVTFMGVATSTGEHMTWTDAGQPMFCIDQKDYVEERSAIDPSIFTGLIWLEEYIKAKQILTQFMNTYIYRALAYCTYWFICFLQSLVRAANWKYYWKIEILYRKTASIRHMLRTSKNAYNILRLRKLRNK